MGYAILNYNGFGWSVPVEDVVEATARAVEAFRPVLEKLAEETED